MTEVWLYVVGASKDPDNVRCMVPWRVDEGLIFFGPCMKRIREHLRKLFLNEGISHSQVRDDFFIVGVNGVNKEKIRKIVWAGRLSEVMTFAEADSRLGGDQFLKLREHPCSPLHVRPVDEGGKLVGYEHASELHKNGEWVTDLVSKSAESKIEVKGPKLILKRGRTPWQEFDRDCCMLLENRFFASGQGIEFGEEALEILREAQPEKSGIDGYAVFGRTVGGQVNGLRGTFLRISGDPAKRFVTWLEDRSRKASKHQKKGGNGPTKTHCH
jgi:hypothetical protein